MIMEESVPRRMPPAASSQSVFVISMVAVLWLGLGLAAAAGDGALGGSPALAGSRARTELGVGFGRLYNLDFTGAKKDFSSWESLHPDDPVGPVSQAAGFLFSEFDRLGVLEGQLFAT